MSILFTKVSYKNFLASGNAETIIPLDKHPTTLVVGENGSGKSTMLDAICFALFGRPFRNVNKGQLVNSINKKNCLVTLEFSIGAKEYKVVRGIKPNKFEIYVNKELLNQDAAMRDYQAYLEENVLKLNFKSFTQIVILGSASFTPFMQLPAASRREIIEDILDIRIFTTMNGILKTKQSEMKDRLVQVEANLTVAKNSAKNQHTYIKSLEQDRQERIDEISEKINSIRTIDIVAAQSNIDHLEVLRGNCVANCGDGADFRLRLASITQDLGERERRRNLLDKDINFYKTNDACPVCKQEITATFKDQTVEEKLIEIDHLRDERIDLERQRASLLESLKNVEKVEVEIKKLDIKIDTQKREIAVHERFIQTLLLEQADLKSKIGDLDSERIKLKELAKDVVKLTDERTAAHEEKHYMDIASTLLKDSGIKTKIIRQYLLTINKLVNKYLHAMDFFVSFELDEEFKENIKSRHRDEFSYESFSEGEKQRIDLALVFTWRTIAKMKNSTSTNLLILDEVFDSSLDTAGTEYVIELLKELGEQTNVWVISHKGDVLTDKFHNTVKFVKKQNFSTME